MAAEIVKNDVQLDVNPTAQGNLLNPVIDPSQYIEVDDSELEQIESDVLEEDDAEEIELVDEIDEEPVKKETKKATSDTTKTKTETKSESSDDTNPISYFGLSLKEHGILSDIDDEDFENVESLDDLSSLVEKQVETDFNNWKEPYVKNIIDNLIKDGYIKAKDVNVGYTIKESDITNEKVAVKFMEEYYRGKGYEDRVIQKLIDKADDILDEARSLVPDYNKTQQELKQRAAKSIEQQEAEIAKKQEKLFEDIKKNVDNVTEFIPGRKVNSTTKDKVYNNVGSVWAKIYNDATKYAPILAYLDHYGILDGKFDSITKLAESETTKKLKNLLVTKPIKNNSFNKRKVDSEEDEDFRVKIL